MTDFIADADFKPDAPSASGAAPDFIPDAKFISDEDRYGDTVGQLKAFGLGAARSLSFGLSDEFLAQTGAMAPDDIKAYRDENPISSGAGEVAGVLGAALAPEVGIAGAVSAPVRGVARAGAAVTEAAAPLASRAAGVLAGAETSPVIHKILSQFGAYAAGSAIEGAAYGLGQTVSEHALGDPDLTAEKVIANVGTSAAIGGALGGIFGAIKGGLQAKKFISEVDKAKIEGGDWEAIGDTGLPEKQRTGFLDGLSKKKANAKEIEAAAREIDAPLLPSMTSANEDVQHAQSMLLNGAPTLPSLKAKQIATEGLTKVEAAAQSAIGAETDITKASLGDMLRDTVTAHVERQAEPINALYDELKTRHQAIPASERALKQVAANVRKLEDVPFSPQARSIAESAAERIESIQTVDDIKRLKSILNQELGLAATPIQKRITSVIADKLADLEESSIVRFAEKEMKTATAQDKIISLLEQRKAVNAQYEVFRDGLNRVGEALGRKRVHGAQDFLDYIGGLTPEKIADKLSGKNNARFLDWFANEMPDGMRAISQYHKGTIREAALHDGKLSVARVLSQIDRLSPEFRAKIFSPEEMRKLDAVRTYFEAFPKNFNPSNTANQGAFAAFFHPVEATFANVKDAGISAFIHAATAGGEEAGALVDALALMERKAIKTSKAIGGGIGAIFSHDKYNPTKGYLAISSDERRDNHDGVREDLTSISTGPDRLIARLEENTATLSQFAPRTTQGVQSTMIRATQFLSAKLPGKDVSQKPLSAPYRPSEAELAQWHKYFSAVDNPVGALHQVARGTLTPQTMEALSAVYPKLLQDMRVQVMDKMTDAIAKKKPIPYRTKLSLSLFLNTDLVNSLTPVSVLATQNTMSAATGAKDAREAQQMRGGSAKKTAKLDGSSRMMTPMQQVAQRDGN